MPSDRCDLSALPFSYTYKGREYRGFPQETMLTQTTEASGEKETREMTFALEELTARVRLTRYRDIGAAEWTVYFENNGTEPSGILECPETRIEFPGGNPRLCGILGDHFNSYRPYTVDLDRMPASFTSGTGRPTHVNFPYFNLECGEGGYLLAIGWAGTWHASFDFNGETTLYTAGSANGLHTYLKPGESIRTALFAVVPYTGRDGYTAINTWRRWFLKYNLPKADASGADLQPFSACNFAGDTGLPNSDGSISERYYTWKPSLDKMVEEDVKVDFRWFDAGWYVAPDGSSPESDWWGTVGTWELDQAKWPGKSFLESTDYTRSLGMKTLMWFEPERVTHVDDLVKNFGYKKEWAVTHPSLSGIVNNIGDPECLAWTTERICRTLRENKVEMYREDNNFNPGKLWAYRDSLEGSDRRGITECRVVTAHYKLWDDIIACTLSYGGCGFVDSCAGGGGRNDLESLRRGVPMLRSDADRTTTVLRLSMTTAFNQWIPFCGASTRDKQQELAVNGLNDTYAWRASYLPILHMSALFVQNRDPKNFDELRFGLKEWKQVKDYLLKDFYPLTPWHGGLDSSGMTAYCFFDPESRRGVLLAFRQETCAADTLTVNLPFAGEKSFTVTDQDTGEALRCEKRLTLSFDQPRTARLLWLKEE